jgi:hypothetical protein
MGGRFRVCRPAKGVWGSMGNPVLDLDGGPVSGDDGEQL